MQILASLLSGLVFGLGLLLSGMANPAKVQAFLDLTGAWDPSLMLVMGGALLVGLFAFHLLDVRGRPLLDEKLHMPTRKDIDRRLVLGSILFGAGWGLAGYCPGPALVSLGMGSSHAIVFVVAMIAGMLIFEMLERRARISAALAPNPERAS